MRIKQKETTLGQLFFRQVALGDCFRPEGADTKNIWIKTKEGGTQLSDGHTEYFEADEHVILLDAVIQIPWEQEA